MGTASRAIAAIAVFAACAGSQAQEERAQIRERGAPRHVRVSEAGYEIGALPEGFGEVRWPEPPRIERELRVRDASEADRAAAQRGTRIVLERPIDRLTVRADDVEVRMARDARVGHLLIERGIHRVRLRGGRYGTIELSVPAQYVPPPPVFRAEWLVSDVMVDGVRIDADDTALFVRGQRVAIVNSRARAGRYSVWCGDTTGLHSEDLVIAGNQFVSAGPESTVRLVDVRRAIVVDNELSNTDKHDFRVHGDSDDVVFARNRLLHTGIMVGSMEGDRIGSVWLLDNAVYHTAPSLLQAPPDRIRRLIARGNRVYTDSSSCFVCERASGWEIGENPIAPYRAPE